MDDSLTLTKSDALGDWYLIERAEHDGREWMEKIGENAFALMRSSRISDADVEGTAHEMVEIAKAIKGRGYLHFKRCAVDATNEPVKLWSPRNSQKAGEVSRSIAEALADQIFSQFAGNDSGSTVTA